MDSDGTSTISSINVYVRSRPLFASEVAEDGERNALLALPQVDPLCCLAPGCPNLAWSLRGSDTVVDNTDYTNTRAFAFNGVISGAAGNAATFQQCAQSLIDNALGGVNCSLIAYGQTGSGKTHSVLGTASDPGILPLSLNYAWELMEAERVRSGTAFSVSVSYLEIYNEEINDLLQRREQEGGGPGGAPRGASGAGNGRAAGGGRTNLKILGDDPVRGALVENLREVPVASCKEVSALAWFFFVCSPSLTLPPLLLTPPSLP
jgi:hypothetical protein